MKFNDEKIANKKEKEAEILSMIRGIEAGEYIEMKRLKTKDIFNIYFKDYNMHLEFSRDGRFLEDYDVRIIDAIMDKLKDKPYDHRYYTILREFDANKPMLLIAELTALRDHISKYLDNRIIAENAPEEDFDEGFDDD